MDLPVGFRFIPTALQLVRDYLSKKIMNQELPSDAVEECDVYGYEPWQLQGDHTEYYFVRREKKFKKNETSRMPVRRVNPKNGTSSFGGFWKATAGDKRIFDKKGNLIGRMKTLVFCLFANQKRTTKEYQKTNWIMHEYNLFDTTPKVNFQPWVLCSIRNNGVHQNTNTLRKAQEQPQARARAEETVTEHALVEDNLINESEETVPVDQEKLQPVTYYFEDIFEDLPETAIGQESILLDKQLEQQMLSYYNDVFEDLPETATEDDPFQVKQQEVQQVMDNVKQMMNNLSTAENVFEDVPAAAIQDEPMQVDQQQVHQIDDADHYVIDLCTPTTDEEPDVWQQMNNLHGADYVIDLRTPTTEEEPVVRQQMNNLHNADYQPQSYSADNKEFDDLEDFTDVQTTPSSLLQQSSFWKEIEYLKCSYPLDGLDDSLLDKGLDDADYVVKDLRKAATEEEPVVQLQKNNLHDAGYQPQSYSGDNIELGDLEELTDLQTTPSSLLQQSSFWEEIEYLQRSYPVDDLDYSFLDNGWDQAQPLFL